MKLTVKIKLHSLLLLLTLAVCFIAHAQHGNEWIRYDQSYWRFQVVNDGVYRITYNELLQSGFPISNIDDTQLQLFGRKREQPIRVERGADNTFGPGDYIEFYGERNDGWMDSLIYRNNHFISNPEYSLFNDTAMYFLTAGNTAGLRTNYSQANNFSDYTALPYVWKTAIHERHDNYLIGWQDINGISLPWYENAEGWFGPIFGKGSAYFADLLTPNAFNQPNGPSAQVYTISAGASSAAGAPNHHLQIGWGNPAQIAVDTSYYDYQLNQIRFSIPNDQLSNTTRIVHQSIDNLGVPVDNHAVSYIELKYPHSLQFSGENMIRFEVENLFLQSFGLLEMTGVSFSQPRLFVLSHGIKTEVQLTNESGILRALVPFNGNNIAQLLLIDDTQTMSVSGLRPATATGFFTNYSVNEIQNAFLIVAAPQLINACNNYAAYRNSTGQSSLVVNIEELYMQYAAGIWKNPLAIRQFCDDLLDNWSSDPAYLFLVGKSIHEMSISASIGARNGLDEYSRNLLPTWGWPCSDLAITSQLNNNNVAAAIPTGRLAAKNEQEVLDYLNKIVEHESHHAESWQKNILHFGGGIVQYEQTLFHNYLDQYAAIATDTSYGAVVHTFLKNTTEPIQLNVSDSIQTLINEGASLMTFFGHASSTGFDQNIDSPESYSNQGKYPLLIGNSCYTGNIHLSESQSTSENFVLVPNRGMIGFIAKSDLGVPTYLDLFTSNFYRDLFQRNYGKSIGECMRQSVLEFEDATSFYRTNVALTFALHGDPSVHLFTWEHPDYSVKSDDITFSPSTITAQVDSFTVNILVENLGKAIHQPVSIELIRHYPTGVDSSYVAVLPEVINHAIVSFELPIDPLQSVGQNTFDVYVDFPANAIEELEETQNNIVIGKSLLITSGDLIPVYPYEFAVVPDAQITLKANTGYVLEGMHQYKIQIDTTALFNSPFMTEQTFGSEGGVIEWPLPFALQDSAVYFWRCSRDSTSSEDTYRWRNSSFQYLAGQIGWGQSSFFQTENNELSGLHFDATNEGWTFESNASNLKCEVYGNALTTYDLLGTRWQLNLDVQDYSGPGLSPCLMVAVVDSVSLHAWESNYNGTNPGFDFGNNMGSANDRQRAERYFIFFQNNPTEMENFASMVSNAVPNGDYLLVYTWRYADYSQWPQAAFDAFTNLGAQQIGVQQDSVPFIFFIKKGHPETMTELYGQAPNDHLVLSKSLFGLQNHGTLSSPLIGPSSNWQSTDWKFTSLELAENDSLQTKLYGIDGNGQETLLLQYPTIDDMLPNLHDYFDSALYPYLRLATDVTDNITQTPPQLKRWHVLCDPAPECALDPTHGYFLSKDTLAQGEPLRFAMAIQNISDQPMDSLLVDYRLESADGQVIHLPYSRQAGLAPGAVLMDTITIATSNLSGVVMLFMEANPKVVSGQYDQMEQFHFNNIVQVPLMIETDRVNPLLDVTFDGMHILNNDIVSTQPHILISLLDENPFLLMNSIADTSHFKVFLTDPSGVQSSVYFGSSDISLSYAQHPGEKFKIIYTPHLRIDGKYSLLVQATDKSGNSSGAYDYRINFEVIGTPSISDVLNYPNPFSTRTQFVFTVTGSVVPDEMKIQIMTIDGRIVREITQSELGPLRVGRNFSEYWWDGKDEFGDQLANGVYLYRVSARISGEDLEHRATPASGLFKKGFGKMYLLR